MKRTKSFGSVRSAPSRARNRWKKWWGNRNWFSLGSFSFGVGLIAVYFWMDAYLLNVADEPEPILIFGALAFALGILFFYYVFRRTIYPKHPNHSDVPSFVRKERLYILIGFFVLIALDLAFTLCCGQLTTEWFPNLGEEYYTAQILLLVLITPIMEELTFRYILYDCWAKPKFGPIRAFLLTGFIFVICHPVTSINAMILYWLPTLMFYLIYENFGLYGSILAHMIFNFIAL